MGWKMKNSTKVLQKQVSGKYFVLFKERDDLHAGNQSQIQVVHQEELYWKWKTDILKEKLELNKKVEQHSLEEENIQSEMCFVKMNNSASRNKHWRNILAEFGG